MAEYGDPLSEREIEVLEQVATGATNREIAQELVVSVNTVKVHLRNIYTKLGVESRTEATLIAIREGLVNMATAEAAVSVPEAFPATVSATVEHPAEAPVSETLPWPKRLALVASLILVILGSVATWPRAQTAAVPADPDTDSVLPGGANGNLAEMSTDWRILAPMTTGRSRFALAATAEGTLYAIGGETNGGVTGSVERYDPETNQWTLLTTSKPTRVSNISAAIIGEWLYIPGGRTAEGEPTAIVEAFNLKQENWHQVQSLPHPLYTYALAVFSDKIYLFGGRDDHGYASTTYIYDPDQDVWHFGREMPDQRAYAAAAALGSRIFVVGGYDGQHEQSTCQAYRPAEDAWETCTALTQGRGGLGLVAVANRLYAIGGGWSNYLGFSEMLNPRASAWTPFETPVSRQWHNLAVAATASKFFIAGGWKGEYLNGVWEYTVLPYEIFIPAAQP